EQDGWVKQDRFLGLVKDGAFIRQLGIEADSLEGYLFPETYTLVRNEADEAAVIRMMVERFQQTWQALNAPESLELNRHQLLTLASVVEKETGVATERPLIAQVFYNRLARKMRLQSDPTVIYGLPDFNGNLSKADLKRETPYNTYLIPGLPPGPICNPGRAALEAVLHPVESDALYFVAKNDGTHIFSTNLADHNRAVQHYQRGQ
ncbi:MAG: endolytic transglycosylase MltG, partial [Desulfobulbus sp.]|nr:endolytic transglycosylase MltG [Desulfobulbus sp.]